VVLLNKLELSLFIVLLYYMKDNECSIILRIVSMRHVFVLCSKFETFVVSVPVVNEIQNTEELHSFI
jgi:hypothetical protein